VAIAARRVRREAAKLMMVRSICLHRGQRASCCLATAPAHPSRDMPVVQLGSVARTRLPGVRDGKRISGPMAVWFRTEIGVECGTMCVDVVRESWLGSSTGTFVWRAVW
jgi:hypothetical protein